MMRNMPVVAVDASMTEGVCETWISERDLSEFVNLVALWSESYLWLWLLECRFDHSLLPDCKYI